MKNVLLIATALMICAGLSACNPRDPSRFDVKSPCVSNDVNGNAPCARRNPVENDIG